MSKIKNLFKDVLKGGFSPFAWIGSVAKNLFGVNVKIPSLLGAASSYLNAKTGAGLTGAQEEQNAWNAEEAQKSRDWTEQMDNTKYQRQTQDMQAAGLNPAMMYGGSVSASGVTGAQASGSSEPLSGGLVDDIMNVLFAKSRLENLSAEKHEIETRAEKNVAEANAATENASSNARQAAVSEVRADIERDLADKDIELKSNEIGKLVEDTLYTRELRSYVSKNYDVAVKNANSLERNSIAAFRQADAAVQNAATNSYISDYQTDLMFSQTLLNDLIKGEHKVILDALPEKTKLEIENLRKEGVVLDKKGRLINRQGNLVSAMTVRQYINCATDVANTVANFIPFSGKSGGSSVVGGTPDLYGGLGTYY